MVQSKYTIKKAELAKKTKIIKKNDKKVVTKKKTTLVEPVSVEENNDLIVENEEEEVVEVNEEVAEEVIEATQKVVEEVADNNDVAKIAGVKTIRYSDVNDQEVPLNTNKFKINKVGFKADPIDPIVTNNKCGENKENCKVVTKKNENVKNKITLNKKQITLKKEKEKENKGNLKENKGNGKENNGNDEEMEDEPVVKKVKEVSKDCVQLAIRILKKIDPNNKMKKEEVISILKEYSQSVNDLAVIQAVEYLLDSFDNLEDNLRDFEDKRIAHEEKLKSVVKLDKEVFNSRISLDSDERDPDENDRIFTTGKEIYSNAAQKYKVANDKQKDKFMTLTKPKKDPKKLKEFGI